MKIQHRCFLPRLIKKKKLIGAELGVAAGQHARLMLLHNKNLTLHLVDKWDGDRGHGMQERRACEDRCVVFSERVIVQQATFQEWASLQKDGYFDFIYIDGYAHTGQGGGLTLDLAWPKLRPGGLFAGHDYHPAWQPTMDVVDVFSATHKLDMGLTSPSASEPYPSWYFWKPVYEAAS